MPVNTISASGGSRTDHILLSTQSLVTTIKDEKPKRMLAIDSKPLVNSKETCVAMETCFKVYGSING